MDVYGDSPTIVTVWLSVLPKLSILILLLEIYLQIDNIENSLIIFNPLLDSLIDTSFVLEGILDYVKEWGGLFLYELNKTIGMPSIDKLVDVGVMVSYYESLNLLLTDYSIYNNINNNLSSISFEEVAKWKVEMGGGNSALKNLLFISSLLSLIIGTVLGLAQSQIKRLLA